MTLSTLNQTIQNPWTPELKKELLSNIHKYDKDELLVLKYDWDLWRRDNQKVPDDEDWYITMFLCGRGWGKTRVGAEWTKERARANPNAVIALGARNSSEQAVMISQGIMKFSPPWFKPVMTTAQESTVGKRVLKWPNGAIGVPLSAENADDGRGWNFTDAWLDELAAFKKFDMYDNVIMALRAGRNPRMIITTTPKPVAKVKQIMKSADENPLGVRLITGNTYENEKHIPKHVLDEWTKMYEGTALGRQELWAEIVETSGALWKYEWIEDQRIKEGQNTKEALIESCERIVVAIDPAITATADSDETGIIVVGRTRDNRGIVFRDASGIMSPEQWAAKAVLLFREYQADMIVAENNQGGDMVEATIKAIDRNVPYEGVRATRGKYTRAEPAAQLYKEGRISHLGATGLSTLEYQLTDWIPSDPSPDRLDALVWALFYLFLDEPMPDEPKVIWI